MKYCSHCGAEIDDEAVICVNCGCEVKDNNQNQEAAKKAATLGKVAKVFMIISMVALILGALSYFILAGNVGAAGSGYTDEELIYAKTYFIIYGISCLLGLAWVIPMTVSLSKKLKNNQPISVAFKVCTLLFVNLISGICLLCRTEPDNK